MELVNKGRALPLLQINGGNVFYVQSYTIKHKRTVEPVEEVYRVPSRLHAGTARYEIQCRQVVPAADGIAENSEDIAMLENFELKITDGSKETIFQNCLWESITEEHKAGEHRYGTIVVQSPAMMRAG